MRDGPGLDARRNKVGDTLSCGQPELVNKVNKGPEILTNLCGKFGISIINAGFHRFRMVQA